MDKRFNLRQIKYKANRIRGMTQYNAARAAGYSETYSRDHSEKIEQSVKVGIAEALEQAGLTPSYRAEEIVKLTKAMKITGFTKTADNAVRLGTHKHISELLGDVRSKVEHLGIPENKPAQIIIIRDTNGLKDKAPTLSRQVHV